MNYTSRSPFHPVTGSTSSFSNYRKFSNCKLQSEKKALQNTYYNVMNSLNKNLSMNSPSKLSSIVCLKSAPIDSDSDDFIENIVFPSINHSSPTKLNLSSKNANQSKSQSQSTNQQMMEYFNDFNDSLLSLQNEISEIRSMIASTSSPNFK